MATLSLHVPDDVLARFEVWSADRGGRDPVLCKILAEVAASPPPKAPRLLPRPCTLRLRLTADDGRALAQEALAMGLTATAWGEAFIHHRLTRRPTFPLPETTALIAIQAEYRRLGVNVNHIARTLNTATLDGRVLNSQLAYLENLRKELRAHLSTLRAACEANQAYWSVNS